MALINCDKTVIHICAGSLEGRKIRRGRRVMVEERNEGRQECGGVKCLWGGLVLNSTAKADLTRDFLGGIIS